MTNILIFISVSLFGVSFLVIDHAPAWVFRTGIFLGTAALVAAYLPLSVLRGKRYITPKETAEGIDEVRRASSTTHMDDATGSKRGK